MKLKTHTIKNFQTRSGYTSHIYVTYQLFGQPLGAAPVVLVNHALTGNSTITGPNGWWKALIGKELAIDTDCFTILAIDIPGNGYDDQAQNLIAHYKQFTVFDIARIQNEIIKILEIKKLFAVIGGSLGGQIAWELAVQQPHLIKHLIPVASDWKATDWVVAQCHIQDAILNNSSQPLQDSRKHAMTFYRTPASFKAKFNRTKKSKEVFHIESWLVYHGQRLKERFSVASYKMMNHLLRSADITAGVSPFKDVVKDISAKIHLVAIDTDGFFLADEIYQTHLSLKEAGVDTHYHEIQSIHGHDAFLIEYKQLSAIVQPIFQKQLCHK